MTNTIFDNWKGKVEINGNTLDNVDFSALSGAISIHLMPNGFVAPEQPVVDAPEIDTNTYKVKVRAWMTKTGFEFMDKWNNGVPMPLRIMVGQIDKETEKMYHMQLHGDILEKVTQTCMCCGKQITNEVSKYFGMGPVCGKHNYINPFGSVEELKAAVADYRVKLQNMTWEGWIPKSAIETLEILKEEKV